MPSDSSTAHIRRNRPPRVHISYEDPYDSEKMVELPFVLGVMSDLSGNDPEKEKPEMGERKFTDVTSATLDDYMEDVAPGTTFNVENKLDPDAGTKLGVQLRFNSMEDFGPAQVARQVPALNELLKAREHLANLARYMSSKPAAQEQIRKLLNDPDLMAALAERDAAAEAEPTPEEGA
ncbi:MAG: type VI secretion system contractile sheath small subunit [Pseudomonadota bacterium]